MASQIQLLKPLSGYLCITGQHRAFVRFPYAAPIARQESFIPRVNLPTTPRPQSPANVTDFRPVRPHRKRI
jgi:hypothetical protein